MKQAYEAWLRELRIDLRHPRVRVSLWGLIVSFVLGAASLLYAGPALMTNTNLTNEIEAKRRVLVDSEFTTRLVRMAEHANREAGLLEPRLRVQGAQLTLVKRFADLARRHGVRILGESYDEGRTQEGYASLVHELNLHGSYSVIRQYLGDLQDLPTFTLVQEAVLTRASGFGDVKVRLRLVTYRAR